MHKRRKSWTSKVGEENEYAHGKRGKKADRARQRRNGVREGEGEREEEEERERERQEGRKSEVLL